MQSVPAHLPPGEQQEDTVSDVARVLSDVQQARVDLELRCALTEAQEECSDLGQLLQSSNNSEE